jgi:hypothetical protein
MARYEPALVRGIIKVGDRMHGQGPMARYEPALVRDAIVLVCGGIPCEAKVMR